MTQKQQRALDDMFAFGRGLRDNTVPNILGGPVDLINLVPSMTGYGPQTPVGGSAWIRQQLERAGITPPSQGNPMEDFGGMVGGMFAPGGMAKAGRAAFKMEQNAAAPMAARSGPLGAQIGAIGPNKRAIGNMFDPITDPAEAMRIAKSGAHIKRDPTGSLVGAPQNINTPADLARNRANVVEKARTGGYNADWYDRARNVTTDLTPDPAKQKLFARGTAAYSPQAQPDFEVNAFTRQYNDRLFGDGSLRPRTEVQRVNVQAGIDAMDGNKIRLGKKTGPYADAKDPTIPDADLYKTANDIWHGRVMGYTGKDGTPFSRGFTPQEHGFLTGENLLISDRLTRAGAPVGAMPEGTPWTPRRMQAATWGEQRLPKYIAEQMTPKQIKAGAEPTPGQIELAKARASAGIDNSVERNTAYVTGEMVPGVGLGHLDNVAGLSAAEREAFSAARRGAVSDADGRGLLYRDAGMYTRPAVSARGEFTNPQGVTEYNPMYADRPLIGLSSVAKKGLRVEPSNADGLSALTNLDALVNAQHATPWHKVTPRNSSMPASQATGGRITAPTQQAYDAIKQALGADGKMGAVDTGDGLSVMDFSKSLGGKDAQKALKAAMKRANANGPTGLQLLPGRVDSNYSAPFDNGAGGTFPPGSGMATQQALDKLAPFPRVEQNIDAAGNWRAGVGKLNDMDRATAAQTGGPVRDDLMRLREIISTQGLAGLRDWVAKNGPKGLPAALLGLQGLRDDGEASR